MIHALPLRLFLYLCSHQWVKQQTRHIHRVIMRKAFSIILFLFTFLHLSAQTDYLEPMKDVNTYKGELREYYQNAFALLSKGFQKQPYARYVVFPTFSPEYALSVEQRQGKYYLISNTLSSNSWNAKERQEKVAVISRSIVISKVLYGVLGDLFRVATSQIQDMDGYGGGVDGMNYFFFSSDVRGKQLVGRKWSPESGTLMERLVLISESAYQISLGKNLSATHLLSEAQSLLKDLRLRTKNDPDGYKTPIYKGAYSIGVRKKTLSGKIIDALPELPGATVDAYVKATMRYPKSLLLKKMKGYVICEFTIDKAGQVVRPRILKSTHPEFAEEALRIVNALPEWKPARSGGEQVECIYTLYIPFRP